MVNLFERDAKHQMKFGHWSIDEAIFEYIKNTLPKGNTILELGSGYGTKRLAEAGYKMYSVEHDKDFVGQYDSTYLYAPLCRHKEVRNLPGRWWYSSDILSPQLRGIKYDLLLVDGPPKWRAGFFKYRKLFDLNAIVLIDDYEREIERKMVNSLATELGRPYIVYGGGVGKPFAVFNDPRIKGVGVKG
jgi:hypothetical protein